jgi:twitching motility protein PilT
VTAAIPWASQKDRLLHMDKSLEEQNSTEIIERRESCYGNTARLDAWLSAFVAQHGSDLLLIADAPPSIRFEGVVKSIGGEPLTGQEIESAVLPALTPRACTVYRDSQIADSSYRIAGVGRFRINLHRERGVAAAAVRALPVEAPTLRELHLPAIVEALTRLPRGLVLIGGPAGSGKTTTVAALVNEINCREDTPVYGHCRSRRDRDSSPWRA